MDGEHKEVAASKLATYSSTHMAASKGTTWSSSRHMPPSVATLGRVTFKKLYHRLSKATRRCKGFNHIQARIMKSHNFTRCHTDTRVDDDVADGKPKKICQKPDTDVVICTIGDTQTFWRKKYPGREKDPEKKYPWLTPSVLLKHGTFWIWRTGHDESCDDCMPLWSSIPRLDQSALPQTLASNAPHTVCFLLKQGSTPTQCTGR